jgi:hypothetical protein
MELRIHFNDNEIRSFFEDRGYNVVIGEFDELVTRYHNRDDYVSFTKLALQTSEGKLIEAEKLFKTTITAKLKNQIIKPESTDNKIIDNEIKNML